MCHLFANIGKCKNTGNKFTLLLFFNVFLFCLISCSQNGVEEKATGEPAFATGDYKITFSLPGDDFASTIDLEQLLMIKEIIAKQGAGIPVSSGSGIGYMELTVNIDSKENLNTIKDIIHDNYPLARFKVEQVPSL